MPRSTRIVSLSGAFALLLLAQACNGKPADAAPAMPPELAARSAAMIASWDQEDVPTAAAFYTDSAVVIVNDSTYRGLAAIRDRWIVPGLPVVSDLTVSDQVFTGSGASMTETGRFSETITRPGQAPERKPGTYAAEWTNLNGTWMLSRFTVKGDRPAS